MTWFDMMYDIIRYGIIDMIDKIWCDWYDLVWLIWYDMIWYDMIWYDMIWYDMIWYDMIWYDMIWHMLRLIWYGMNDMIDMIWCDWYDMMWLIWYMIWYGRIWLISLQLASIYRILMLIKSNLRQIKYIINERKETASHVMIITFSLQTTL